MKAWPQSLAGRTLVLVFAAVLLCQAATFAVFAYYRRDFIVQHGVRVVVGYAQLLQTALNAAPESQRQRLLATMRHDDGIHVVAHPAEVETLQEPIIPLMRQIAAQVGAELGENTQVRIRREPPLTFWISLRAADRDWWLVFPIARFEEPLPWGWLALLTAIIGITLGLSSVFVLGIVRPVRELGAAAQVLGAGCPRPARPGGPLELKRLAESFNTMLGQLQRNERERRVMLAGLPHDLRAPLARLRLRLEMVDDADLRTGLQRDAEDIQHISRQFLAYLQGLDETALTLGAVDLTQRAAVHVRRHRELGRMVSLMAPSSVGVRGNPEALDRLLDNLLENAFRYGAEPVEIRIEQDAQGVCLTVRDHGPGIAPEHRQRALEPFSQLDAARGIAGNCGLGLAIVEHIARVHGGRVELDSAVGGGLQVRVALAVRRTHQSPPPLVDDEGNG